MMRRTFWIGFGGVVLLAATFVTLQARQISVPQVAVDPDDIGGAVEGPEGPEAGVWVIAETDDLPTRFRKIVVTDDRGRFLLPDLPRATYRVWVRGYGLVDSSPVTASPAQTVELAATPAPTPQAAAEFYPPSYWLSLLEVPGPSEFPGTGEAGNGISENILSQTEWIGAMKMGCLNCHQMGDRGTRTTSHLTAFTSSVDAWDHRVSVGQRHAIMNNVFTRLGRQRALQMFADWTDRIAAGEVPPAPPRPAGVERNVVLTMWDWGEPTSYVHDMISTDKREPTVNADGLIYGVDYGRDYLTVLDPVEGKATEIKIPVRDADVRPSLGYPSTTAAFPQSMRLPSPYWGEEIIWRNIANPHNPMMDGQGRVWITTQIRNPENQPPFCREGSTHPSAQFFTPERSGRQVAVFDPATQEFTLIDTCFTTHHLQFAEDDDNTLYLSSAGTTGDTIGWINTRIFDETGDAAQAQGWCPTVLDTNGDGKAGPYVVDTTGGGGLAGTVPADERAMHRAVTPGMDLRIDASTYGIIVNPVDHSVWAASTAPFPGMLIRYDPATCVAEVYEPPYADPAAVDRFGTFPRGVDVDRNGLIWTALAGTGHTASFDRSKCNVLNGPTATGQHCPEGWTTYRSPGPQLKGVTLPGGADYHYYNWVVGGPVQRAGTGREYSHCQRHWVGFPACGDPGDGGDGCVTRPVSGRLLHARVGWPHRRPGDRLEGSGALGQ